MSKLKKRKDGRYQLNVYIGRSDDGKERYRSVYGKTQKEVRDKADAIKLQLGKGLDLINAEITFSELKRLWSISKEPLLRPSQLKDYLTSLKPFVPLEEKKINRLIKSDFQSIINEYARKNPRTGKPTAKATLSAYRMAARQVMDFAVENRILDYNPLTYVRIPKDAPKEKRRALTEQEQQWIINTPHRAQLPAMLMMLAGLRLEECLGLQWKDIDLRSAVIHVHQKLLYKESPPRIEQGAKTAAGVRDVDIPKTLVTYLKQQPLHAPDSLVNQNAHGKPYTATSWKTTWDSYLLTLNVKYGDFSRYDKEYKSKFDPAGVPFVIEKFTAHCLRHTHATNLFHCGKDILYVQHQLGHSKPETTLNIYTHLVKDNSISKTNKVISFDKYIEKISKEQSAKHA